MFRRIVLAAALALACMSGAHAQVPPGAGNPPAPVIPCLITTATLTVCAYGPAIYYGAKNGNGTAAQTATVACGDSTTSSAASPSWTIPALAAGASIIEPGGGTHLLHGLACTASLSPTGTGIFVYVVILPSVTQ